jgi:nucleoside-diphosphate-sugar epimerase
MANPSPLTISIIGCGWLGLPLASVLLSEPAKYLVKGSTTTLSKLELLGQQGIEPYLFRLDPEPAGEGFLGLFEADLIVVDIPPRLAKQGEDFHTQQLKHLIKLLKNSRVRQIIYISSTSVYAECNRELYEQDVLVPDDSATPALVRSELMVSELRPDKRVSVLRCAGLMGYDRIPGKYVKGQKNLTTGTLPVNYIHRDDAVNILKQLIKKGVTDQTFNVVAPQHPTRRAVYEASCREFGWELPTFLENTTQEPFKIVVGDKLTAYLGYSYLFPDPLHFYYEL